MVTNPTLTKDQEKAIWGTPENPNFQIPRKWPFGVSAGQLRFPDKPYDALENPFLPAGTILDPRVPNWVRDVVVDYLRSQAQRSFFGRLLDLFRR